MQPLISTAELQARLDEPGLRIFDCTTFLHPDGQSGRFRIETGRRGYLEEGHIPGAALIELQEELSDARSPLRFTMPSSEDLAERFRAKGIGGDTDVVLYAAGDAWWATRVWWMLHSIGFDRAAILDGGLRKWLAEGRPIECEPRSYAAATSFTAQPRDVFCDKTSVQAALGTGDAVVLNCLRTEQHDGSAAYHYGRPGHITGSVNVPAAMLFAPDGTFRPAAELRALFEAKGIVPGKRTVAYCGGGIAATGDAFALTALLGYEGVTVYDNSLQEWAADPSLPMSM